MLPVILKMSKMCMYGKGVRYSLNNFEKNFEATSSWYPQWYPTITVTTSVYLEGRKAHKSKCIKIRYIHIR